MSTTVITVSNISKYYLIHHGKPTLVEKLFFSNAYDKYWALKRINLRVKKGEFVGVIGLNGAGKTTLLKILSRIVKPSEGNVSLHGTFVSLIELAAGFHPDLTGIENVYLNGMLLGMSKEVITSHINSIIHFADIGKFIYQPVYTYSEGMLLRLGFSIITVADPDILIFDENLFVGDKDFYVKIHETLMKWKRQSKTLILSSHNLHFIRKYCERGILLKRGIVEMDGDIDQVVNRFTKDMPKQFIAELFSKHYDQ